MTTTTRTRARAGTRMSILRGQATLMQSLATKEVMRFIPRTTATASTVLEADLGKEKGQALSAAVALLAVPAGILQPDCPVRGKGAGGGKSKGKGKGKRPKGKFGGKSQGQGQGLWWQQRRKVQSERIVVLTRWPSLLGCNPGTTPTPATTTRCATHEEDFILDSPEKSATTKPGGTQYFNIAADNAPATIHHGGDFMNMERAATKVNRDEPTASSDAGEAVGVW